jgi:hypothetical protein
MRGKDRELSNLVNRAISRCWAKVRMPKADEFAQKAKGVLVFPNVIGVDRKRELLKAKGPQGIVVQARAH